MKTEVPAPPTHPSGMGSFIPRLLALPKRWNPKQRKVLITALILLFLLLLCPPWTRTVSNRLPTNMGTMVLGTRRYVGHAFIFSPPRNRDLSEHERGVIKLKATVEMNIYKTLLAKHAGVLLVITGVLLFALRSKRESTDLCSAGQTHSMNTLGQESDCGDRLLEKCD